MKILMATMGLDIGGAETHIVELAKEMKRRGHDVVIASNGGVYVPECEAAGIKHYSVPMHRRSVMPMLRSYFAMSRIIKRERPDIVHAHARIPGFICGLIRKTRRFPFVTTAHWVFDTGGALRFLTNWGEKTVAVSEDIKQYLIDNYKIPASDIYVTINGIDTEKFSPDVSGAAVREEFHIPASAPVISHVSRMDQSRELAARFLIADAEELDKRVPGVVILIAGGGDVFEELSEKAGDVNRKLGRECIIMMGPRTDINEIVAAGDVFVGVSRAALEAMAASKPVVVAGNEGYLGLFTMEKLETAIGSNFCCRGSEMISDEPFINDIAGCFECGEEKRRSLGGDGRAVVMEHYSVERMAEDSLCAYRAAIPPKKVVLSGYYGFGNAGDEAVLGSVCKSIKENVPGAQVTVLSKDPVATEATYDCHAAGRFNPFAVLNAIRRCDILVSGGGSLLQDRTSTRSLLYYLLVIRLAELFGKKVILYANGIGPVDKEKNGERVRRTLEKTDMITLRDPDSAETLRKMGLGREDLFVGADPALLINAYSAERGREILRGSGVPDGPFVIVSVRPWKDSDGFSEELAKVCDEIVSTHKRNIVFMAMQPGADDAAAESVIEHMTKKAYRVSGDYGAEDLMAVIGNADAVLSMRLHSLVFAANMEIPSVGLVYDPKVESYLELLGMPSAGDVKDFSASRANEAVGRLFSDLDGYKARLSEKCVLLREAARENEKRLTDFMN